MDELTIPAMITASAALGGVPFYDVDMTRFQKELHRDLPPTTLWGYDGMYPSPTFEGRRGRPIAVRALAASGMLLGAERAEDDDVEAAISRQFANPAAAYLHAHNAAHGCFAARIDRA